MNLAAFVVIVAGIRAASDVVILLLLSIFIVVLAAPFFLRMQEKGVPSVVALLILVIGLTVVGSAGVHMLRISLEEIYRNLPRYQENLQQQVGVILIWLESKGVETPDQMIRNALAEKTPVRIIGDAITTATHLLGRGFIVLLIAIFILLEAAILPKKLRSMPNMSDDTYERVKLVIDNVRRYIGMKTMMSALTGVLVGVFLFLLGVDNPVLLGILAFLLNFIPNLGSIMAGAPGVMLAFIEFGLGRAAVVAAGYVVINVFVSNFIEPRYMGRGLGLSPMVIVITLIFWAWVLGPLGMLLSVPLTMALKIAMESLPETRGLALLMGSNPDKSDTHP
ncbi:MAG TPA: AI-2E family transporter [Kiritimatiellia bacterium]|nr:AI-2E family transporter [Kiritimatiellia bacterium]HMO98077.1 AI-2E family transporter [Kiritimatiellia bacterium]